MNKDTDVVMKDEAAHPTGESPYKINYDAYNEQFGE